MTRRAQSQTLPKISLVTPCLNQADLVRDAISSVVSQEYPRLEYIVIDGGSTDGSVDVIREYADRLSYWVSEPDEGHYHAINKGFAKTSGEVMGYLNGDDTLLPRSLWLVGEIFANFPDLEWITGAHTAIDERGRPVDVVRPARWSRWHLLSGRLNRFIPQESTFWRRSLWERSGGAMDEHYALAADFDLWARFFRTARLYTFYAPIGCFRFIGGQRSIALQDDYMREVAEIVERERTRSKADVRATGIASAALWAVATLPGLSRERSAVDTALGAPPPYYFNGPAQEFQMVGDPREGPILRRVFARISRGALKQVWELEEAGNHGRRGEPTS